MSSLIIILRPSISQTHCWKIQIDGLVDDQVRNLSKKIQHIKFKQETITDELNSVRWRIDTSRSQQAIMPITHIAPLVKLFKCWGYELVSCNKGVHCESDIIYWTLVQEEQKKCRKL